MSQPPAYQHYAPSTRKGASSEIKPYLRLSFHGTRTHQSRSHPRPHQTARTSQTHYPWAQIQVSSQPRPLLSPETWTAAGSPG